MLNGTLYSLVVIGGPILLIAAIAWAMLNNRRTPREERRTEDATRAMYQDQTTTEEPNDAIDRRR